MRYVHGEKVERKSCDGSNSNDNSIIIEQNSLRDAVFWIS